jgi:hypothetical protein
MKEGRQTEILEVLPERKIVYLEGLYLGHNLHRISESLGKTLVYANYISNLDDVIAVKDSDGLCKVPRALKNPDDWRLFQELEAQADVTITSRAYLRRIALRSDRAQNVLMQFETGNEFEKLGEWRLQHGFKSRSPDVAIVGRRRTTQSLPKYFCCTRKYSCKRGRSHGTRLQSRGSCGVELGSRHVSWTIKKKITSEITFKGYTVHASKGESQYLIKSDKTDHMAMHKGSARKKTSKSKPFIQRKSEVKDCLRHDSGVVHTSGRKYIW